jgi:20S proteasome subunit alpha 6
MFRNQYDQDVLTWSPQGRLHQVEYAMEAVKQGSAIVACRSGSVIVFASLKRSSSKLSSYQEKIFKMENKIGVAVSGLTADGSSIIDFIRSEVKKHAFLYDSTIEGERLVNLLAKKTQGNTQRSSYRPFGVGIVLGAIGKKGVHLYYVCPSGNVYEHHALAIGSRSQACKTYLEKHANTFASMTCMELISKTLNALREASSIPLTEENCSIATLSEKDGFKFLTSSDLKLQFSLLE